MRRNPAVAGQFYPGVANELRQTLAHLIPPQARKRQAIGIVSPHAGYMYSGAIAGETFAKVKIPQRVVILGPNHHGVGHPGGVYPAGTWETPLGQARVDGELAAAILQGCPHLAADEASHRLEHSLEVQVPFVQQLAPEAVLVPICLSAMPLEDLLTTGAALGEVLSRQDGDILMVASSDMSHYESGEAAREKDMAALGRVLDLDPEGLYHIVRQRGITMCGVIPVVVMLAAARRLGAQKGTLVRYGNSGEITGDQSEVVGYAGVIIE